MNSVWEANNANLFTICSMHNNAAKAMKNAVQHYQKILKENEYTYPIAMNIEFVDSVEPYYNVSLVVGQVVD